MRTVAALLLTALLACAGPLAAQSDLTPPPRLDAVPASGPAPQGRPGETRLAELPEDRREAIDEIVVLGEQPLRLPDLGSERREEIDRAERGRIRVSFLPAYDPEDPLRMRGSETPLNPELRRAGYLEMFRIRFGGRRAQDAQPEDPQ
jgi:hypothetical protein